MLAKRLNAIKPSPTVVVSNLAEQLKREGRDVINLGEGEPDFNTPDHIKEAAVKAIADNKTRYTQVDGIDELKQAVVEKFARENNIDCSPQSVTVGSGAKHVIYNAFMATLDPADEVLIPAPYWVSYPDMVLLAGGVPVPIDCTADARLKLRAEQLEAAITPRTKWLVMNSPGNPAGATYSKQELLELAEVLVRHDDILILMDDIYEHIVFDNCEFRTLAEVAPELQHRILTLNGVSKAYCMTGWRIGYATGPEQMIKAISSIQSHSTSNPNSVAQYAAVAALTGPTDFIASNNRRFSERRDYVVESLNRIRGLDCTLPEGAFFAFPSCGALIGATCPDGQQIRSDVDFVNYLLRDAGVATVPGAAFGTDGFFRISFATSMENLELSMRRIERACEALQVAG